MRNSIGQKPSAQKVQPLPWGESGMFLAGCVWLSGAPDGCRRRPEITFQVFLRTPCCEGVAPKARKTITCSTPIKGASHHGYITDEEIFFATLSRGRRCCDKKNHVSMVGSNILGQNEQTLKELSVVLYLHHLLFYN